MTAKGTLIPIFIVVAILAIIFSMVLNRGGTTGISLQGNGVSESVQIDTEVEELNKIFMEYQLDVAVTGSHMASHSTSSAAIRCLNNKGNVQAFSEFGSRRIHLLCWDNETLYDVIITRINYWVEKFKNPKSELVTAYAPEGVQGADANAKVAWYLEHLKGTVGGKVIRLFFGPGEVMFIPK